MEENKKNKGLIILISVLVAFLLIGLCRFIGFKYGLSKQKTNEINNDLNADKELVFQGQKNIKNLMIIS